MGADAPEAKGGVGLDRRDVVVAGEQDGTLDALGSSVEQRSGDGRAAIAMAAQLGCLVAS